MRAVLGLCLLLLAAPAQAMLLPGDLPPAELGVDVDGKPRHLEEFRGRVVILSFWTSWCAPCHDEMRLLDRLQRRVGSDRVVVVSVNFAQASDVFDELKQHMGGYAMLLTSDPRGELGKKYGVNRIPFSFMINQDGVIRYVYSGYGDKIERLLVEDLDRLLEHAD